MIISEKQIMELITIANNFRSLLLLTQVSQPDPILSQQHNNIGVLIDTIQNQQVEELKVVK